MRKLLLSGCLLAGLTSYAQTTLFQDDFENPGVNWSYNGTGDNGWVTNNIYTGLIGLINDTPNQPGGITNSPQSTYLHITNGTICGLGYCNANFDTGSASNQNAEMSSGVSTLGMTATTVSFWYLCAGSSGTSYGTFEYSIDGGSSWSVGATYVNINAWTQESMTLPAWDNVSDFRVRFKWQNGAAGADPAFSVDEVSITANGSSVSVSTDNSFTPGSWCYDDVVSGNVNFQATGAFTAGNIFTAELSDASGSFAAPTSIGTLSSTSSGSLSIPVSIPGGTAAGTGYRVRVNSSAPASTGTDNGTDLIIHDLPTVALGVYADVCDYTPVFVLTGGLPAGGTYSGTGVGSGSFDPGFAGLGSHTVTYSYTDMNGCQNSSTQPIVVDGCLSIDNSELESLNIFPNPSQNSFSVNGQGVQNVTLIDVNGRVVEVFESQESYNTESIAPGVYTVIVSTETGVKPIKLIKE